MNGLEELAEKIVGSKDGDTIYVLNETRASLARLAAHRLGRKVLIKVRR